MDHWLKTHLGVAYPIIQAPMAGVSSPSMAAAICNAGGLGSLGVGAASASGAQAMISELKSLTSAPFNINVFCHAAPERDADIEAGWLTAMAPLFDRFGASPPVALTEIYESFLTDDAMLEILLAEAPAVVSFHFGLPDSEKIRALKNAGCTLLASATSLTEAKACVEAGIDAIVSQGIEAGGHRGLFDPDGPDAQMTTRDLVRSLVPEVNLPVIAAGGLMTGSDIGDVIALGAVAAQLGTAFVASDESLADAAYRAALRDPALYPTTLTPAVSGRPARCLGNAYVAWSQKTAATIPAYPVTYDATKTLNAAARKVGETGFGAQWSGTGGQRARDGSAGDILRELIAEMASA